MVRVGYEDLLKFDLGVYDLGYIRLDGLILI